MRKLKILQCLVFYLPCRVGGIEVYAHSLNLCLLSKGHDVKVVVPVFPGEKPYAHEYDGVPVITYTEFSNETKVQFEGDAPGNGLKEFREILKKEQPDIVHFHQFTSSNGISLFHIRAARELGIAIIYTNHLAGLTCSTGKMIYREKHICDGVMRNVQCAVCDLHKFPINEVFAKSVVAIGAGISGVLPDNPNGRMLQLLTYSKRIARKRKRVQALMELVDSFIVLTDWYYGVLKANGFNMGKVKIIKQGLPLGHAPIELSSHKTHSDHIRLVFIGRIFPEKGLDVLLKAMLEVDESSCSLDIYGQVDDKDYFIKCEALYKNKSNINYHGFLNSKEIVNTLKKYDALVLPSMIAEMAPLVILEAFAAGIPVIGSDIGGIKEAIKNEENGLLFDMGDYQQLKSIIEELVNNNALLKTLTSEAVSPPSFEEIADLVEQEYFKILSSSANG